MSLDIRRRTRRSSPRRRHNDARGPNRRWMTKPRALRDVLATGVYDDEEKKKTKQNADEPSTATTVREARCTREKLCAERTILRSIRDSWLCSCVRERWRTERERALESFTSELERKEYLGTLDHREKRELERRRARAGTWLAARAKREENEGDAPRAQRMIGMNANDMERDDLDDARGDGDDEEDGGGDRGLEGGEYEDVEAEFEANARERAKWSERLVIGRDLAFAGEGELGEGLRRWEEYIADARFADGMLAVRLMDETERCERELDANIKALVARGERSGWSELDVRIRRDALIAEHEVKVAEIAARERALREKKLKRDKLASLDATTRAKVLRVWQKHADAKNRA